MGEPVEIVRDAFALLVDVEIAPVKALHTIRKEGFVFDGKGGDKSVDQWEKLAFTFYTSLVTLGEQAKTILIEAEIGDQD